ISRSVRDHRVSRERLRAAIEAALSFAAERPQALELLTTGILSAGPEGRERFATAVDALAGRLGSGSEPLPSALAPPIFTPPMIAGSLAADETGLCLEAQRSFLELILSSAEPV